MPQIPVLLHELPRIKNNVTIHLYYKMPTERNQNWDTKMNAHRST